MSDHQQTLSGLTEFVTSDEHDLRDDIVQIAERALWNPIKVSSVDIQTLAAAVVARTRRSRPEMLSAVVRDQRDRLR